MFFSKLEPKIKLIVVVVVEWQIYPTYGEDRNVEYMKKDTFSVSETGASEKGVGASL